MGALCDLSINFQLTNIKFLIKTTNIVVKTLNMELEKKLKHSLKLKFKSANQIMIKLKSRYVRLATVPKMVITGWETLTSSYIISSPTQF